MVESNPVIELALLRLEMREAFHGLDKRLAKLEWTDCQFAESGQEWRRMSSAEFDALKARIAVFEAHKTRFAWLGWSLVLAGGLGALKAWLPALKGLF